MKISRASIKRGRKRIHGYAITQDGRGVFVSGQDAEATAKRIWAQLRSTKTRFSDLVKSLESYKRFNNRNAKRLVTKKIKLDAPLIRIGKMPEITYLSSKEGSPAAYVHRTKKMPTLYYHPTKKIGVIIGGSIKVRDWLYE